MSKITKNVGRGGLVFPNGTSLSIEGWGGTATQWTGQQELLRGARRPADIDTSPRFESALRELDITEKETIHVEPERVSLLRSIKRGPRQDTIKLKIRPTGAPTVVLYQDESGGLSWHFPDGHLDGGKARLRGPAKAATTFTIPLRSAPAQESLQGDRGPAALRSIVTKIGRKVFKVLVMPLASKVIAKPLEYIVGKVEKKYRQNLVRSVSSANYNARVSEGFTDWKSLAGKRSLLIVHGILSSTDGMLSGLPREAMEGLVKLYNKRIIALDHLTLTETPEENAIRFLKQARDAQPAGQFEFDILCHSRGGIVSRTLVERGADLVPDHNCRFRKLFFVATPNAGSALGDPEHVVDMIDVLTNLATNFPDGPVTYTIEGILALVKLLAYTAETAIPGLAAMGTKGYIPDVLNRPVGGVITTEYGCATADYEPDPKRDNGFINGKLSTAVIGKFFAKDGQSVANDLVVPQRGVYEKNGANAFPIKNALVFSKKDHVWHSGFFRENRTNERILEFFSGAAPIVMPGLRKLKTKRSPADYLTSVRRLEKGDWIADLELHAGRRRGSPAPHATPAPFANGGVPDGPPAPLAHSEGIRELPRAKRKKPKGAEPAASELKREPKMSFPKAVDAGKPATLTVSLALPRPEGGGDAISIPVPADKETVELMVAVSASGFDVNGERARTITVGRKYSAAKEKVSFELTARAQGGANRQIRVDFWVGNSCVGGGSCDVTVRGASGENRPVSQGRAPSMMSLDKERRNCDLVIHVEGEDAEGLPPYRVRLSSDIPGNRYEGKYGGKFSLPGNDLAKHLDSFLNGQFDSYPNTEKLIKKWNKGFMEALEAFGKNLWLLLPSELRDEYFRLKDAGKMPESIMIHSDEMIFPWELVIPHRKKGSKLEQLEPLGVRHILGRWKPGNGLLPDPQHFEVKRVSILNPKYDGVDRLPWSESESKALLGLFPSAAAVTPATLSAVRKNLLKSANTQWVHFSGHGEYNVEDAALNTLILEGDGKLTAMDLTATKLGAEAHPFFYMNACSAGQSGMVVGRMGGFASTCLGDREFSGVIAPYWPINDARATAFAMDLYKKLLNGIPVGEALQQIRESGRDDPTAIAFTFFGDPWATLHFGES